MYNRNWIKKGLCVEELYAPFVVEKDNDYFSDLKRKYRLLINAAKENGADESSIKILEKYSEKIRNAVNAYYRGEITKAHNIVKNIVIDCKENTLAVSPINEIKTMPQSSVQLQLFRARVSEDARGFRAKEMLHLPKEMRAKTDNYRFSLPGIPSLYVGNSSYACWIEAGRPADHDFNVSPIILNGSQKIFNLAVKTRDIYDLKSEEAEDIQKWLILLVLMIATSYTVEEKGRKFKSEYIISQSIMLACKEVGLDGIVYYSKRVSNEEYASAAINFALFVNYEKNSNNSVISKNMKIDDSFNFAMFKQLTKAGASKNKVKVRTVHSGRAAKIGDEKRYYMYQDTAFCEFDFFMFSSWKDIDSIPWGNANE